MASGAQREENEELQAQNNEDEKPVPQEQTEEARPVLIAEEPEPEPRRIDRVRDHFENRSRSEATKNGRSNRIREIFEGTKKY